jgi:hypothetical protein
LKLGDAVELEDISVTKAAYNLKGGHIDLQAAASASRQRTPEAAAISFLPSLNCRTI